MSTSTHLSVKTSPSEGPRLQSGPKTGQSNFSPEMCLIDLDRSRFTGCRDRSTCRFVLLSSSITYTHTFKALALTTVSHVPPHLRTHRYVSSHTSDHIWCRTPPDMCGPARVFPFTTDTHAMCAITIHLTHSSTPSGAWAQLIHIYSAMCKMI